MLSPLKNVPWSYSKIKNYETCPKRHFAVDIDKQYKEDSDELREGNRIHDALAKYLLGKKLPPSLERYAKWGDRITSMQGELLVEQKYAITSDMRVASWFDNKTAWYRGIGDAVVLNPPVAFVGDWKTGKRRNVDEVQLALMAQCILVHYPSVKEVLASFIYLTDDSEALERYNQDRLRDEIWPVLMPRVTKYVDAVRTQTFPPNPGFLCARFCPVVSCPHHGK